MTNTNTKTARDFFPTTGPSWLPILLSNISSAPAEIAQSVLNSLSLESLAVSSEPATASQAASPAQALSPVPTPVKPANAVFELVSVENIRALAAQGDSIRLGAYITVFYGRNSSGKSSITQSLKVFTGQGVIPPPGFAHPDSNRDKFAATRSSAINVIPHHEYCQKPTGGHLTPASITWSSDTGATAALDAVVLDRDVVAEKKAQAPWSTDFALGMDAFDRIRKALELVAEKLGAMQTVASNQCARLLANNGEADYLAAIAILTAEDPQDGELETLRVSEATLTKIISEATNAGATRSQLMRSLTDLRAKSKAASLLAENGKGVSTAKQLLEELMQLRKAQSTDFAEVIRERGLQLVHHDEWRVFVEAANTFIKTEYQPNEYPSEGDACIYCGQPLSDAARALIANVQLRLAAETTLRERQVVDDLEAIRAALLVLQGYVGVPTMTASTALDEALLDSSSANFEELAKQLISELEEQEKLLSTLSDEEQRKELIRTSESELQSVQRKLFALRNAVSIREWKLQRDSANKITTIISDVSNHRMTWATQRTKAANELALDAFKKNFEQECDDLGLPFLLDVRVGTDSTQTSPIRKTTALGKDPKQVLSESEHSVWVIADVLAELKTTGKKSALILDDPVTSMDIERCGRLAHKIVDVAEQRQVVVLTHNRHFYMRLKQLLQRKFSGSKERVRGYVVERWRGETGLVSPLDVFKSERIQLLDGVKAILEKPTCEMHDVAAGFLMLRRVLEDCLDNDILKGFRSKLDPEPDSISWDKLKSIQIDVDVVDEIRKLFGLISDFGDVHLSMSSALAQPTRQDLEDTLPKVEAVLTRAKPGNVPPVAPTASVEPATEVAGSEEAGLEAVSPSTGTKDEGSQELESPA